MAAKVQAVYRVWVFRIMISGARDVGGDDVDLLTAYASVDLVKPDRSAPFCRKEKLGEH
jgi:hypothetical protein